MGSNWGYGLNGTAQMSLWQRGVFFGLKSKGLPSTSLESNTVVNRVQRRLLDAKDAAKEPNIRTILCWLFDRCGGRKRPQSNCRLGSVKQILP